MSKIYIYIGIVCLLQIVLAKICGPHSCEWGNEVYFYSGIVLLIVSFFIPFFQHNWSLAKQVGIGFLFVVLGVAVWIAGFLFGSFKLMCRMF